MIVQQIRFVFLVLLKLQIIEDSGEKLKIHHPTKFLENWSVTF